LISHFPCSLDCQASRAIGKERLLLLRRERPAIAERFESKLKSVVIYTATQGVFFSNQYTIAHGRVKYRNLEGTIESDLFHKLNSAGEIRIVSHNCLLIGAERLDGAIGIMLFK
jgi:hypothetical protein